MSLTTLAGELTRLHEEMEADLARPLNCEKATAQPQSFLDWADRMERQCYSGSGIHWTGD